MLRVRTTCKGNHRRQTPPPTCGMDCNRSSYDFGGESSREVRNFTPCSLLRIVNEIIEANMKTFKESITGLVHSLEVRGLHQIPVELITIACVYFAA